MCLLSLRFEEGISQSRRRSKENEEKRTLLLNPNRSYISTEHHGDREEVPTSVFIDVT